jgi:hypothetical protein
MFLDVSNDVAFLLQYFFYAIPLSEPKLKVELVYDM